MKILGAYRSDAAGYYRVVAPFSVLRYRTDHEFDIHYPTLSDAKKYDALWLHQHADATTEIIAREFKARGKVVIYDVDDWLFGLPASWPCYGDFFRRGHGQPRDNLLFHERLLELADVITCTTERLKSNLQRWLSPGRRIEVLPNCIIQGEWDTVVPTGHNLDGPVLGWFGTGNHWDDWAEIVPAIDEALEVAGGHLALIGAPEIVTLLPPRLAARTQIHPLVTIEKFSQVRRLIRSFDVGLAWCTDRLESNRCRSALKVLQYGAAGVPTVASQTVYGEILDGWEVIGGEATSHDYGVTVLDPQRLDEILIYALDGAFSEVLRTQVSAWQREVWESYSYEKQALRWLDLIENLLGEGQDESE